jgi:hypothetical protein
VTLKRAVTRRFGFNAKCPSFINNQSDQIGRNFAVWTDVSVYGRIFSEKCRPNDLGSFKKIAQHSPK